MVAWVGRIRMVAWVRCSPMVAWVGGRRMVVAPMDIPMPFSSVHGTLACSLFPVRDRSRMVAWVGSRRMVVAIVAPSQVWHHHRVITPNTSGFSALNRWCVVGRRCSRMVAWVGSRRMVAGVPWVRCSPMVAWVGSRRMVVAPSFTAIPMPTSSG